MVVTDLRTHCNIRPTGGHTFRYENVWQTHGDYDRVVSQLWEGENKGNGLGGFANTLKCMKTALDVWGTANFGNFKKNLDNLRKELERVRMQSVGRGPLSEEKKLMERINDTLYQEEIWIKQRSRINWLNSGDRNTAFFRAYAAQRKRINTITTLHHGDGSWCDDAESVREEIQTFYTDLYTSDGTPVMGGLLDHVQEKVLQANRDKLSEGFTLDEAKKALFQMHPSKAPGVDGFTIGFYQRHWDLIGESLTATVLGFINGVGEVPESINDTSITLIPKVHSPLNSTDLFLYALSYTRWLLRWWQIE
jgi:hypothetical protein